MIFYTDIFKWLKIINRCYYIFLNLSKMGCTNSKNRPVQQQNQTNTNNEPEKFQEP